MTKSILFLLFSLIGVLRCELLVTKEYTEYLKNHVSWEVQDYENNIFKGWTLEDARQTLIEFNETPLDEYLAAKNKPFPSNLPTTFSWGTQNCVHPVRTQGNTCKSSWAFAMAGMMSDRCCMVKGDKGWLSVQELVSCDSKKNHGCDGGFPGNAVQYVGANGLVHEGCYQYEARDVPCPFYCEDVKDWYESHICQCKNPRRCLGPAEMAECLKSGPITATMGVCRSLYSYKTGIYKCDCEGNYLGQQSVIITGYEGNIPECNWIAKNSWGTIWGMLDIL